MPTASLIAMEVLATKPNAVSWGETKQYLIGQPAGMTVNRLEALKVVRRALTGKDRNNNHGR
jgi:hypothetical protein